MRFFKKTIEYLFKLDKGKRFLALFFLALPAGFAMSAMAPGYVLTGWINNYSAETSSFWSSWTFGRGDYFFPIALGALLVCFLVFGSVMVTILTRSIKIGVFKVKGFFRDFNDSFFPTLNTTLLYISIFLIYKVITALLLQLWQSVLGDVAGLVLSIISMLVIFGLAMFVVTLTSLYLPVMAFTGKRSKFALTLSIHKGNKNFFSMMLAMGIPLLVVWVATSLVGLLDIRPLSFVISTVLYASLFAYLITMSVVAYVDIEGIKREDYPRGYIEKQK
jgi:MFS family permease